ncbi:AI-2E family transporter [Candidatus Pacearchaeota archaeon]|nr:AI-2E family transporter [Candidatus Pacearchaeota archaeon]
MLLDEKTIKKLVALFVVLILIVLAFVVIKPILSSIILGLLLVYMLYPLYAGTCRIVKEKNISALIICFLVVAIIFLLLWFLVPVLIQQTFDFYSYTQRVDMLSPFRRLFPTIFSNQDFSKDILISMQSFVGKTSGFILERLTNILLSIPTILLHMVIIFFTLFFGLRERNNLIGYLKEISPFTKEAEKKFSDKSKAILSSFVYGTIIIGLLQGIATGIGLFAFQIPNALLWTILAILVGILPMIGPAVIWIPASIYLMFAGRTAAGIGFLAYGLLFISWIELLLRPYIVSKSSKTDPFIIFIGMIGGIFVFGMIGLIVGPLILSYLLLVIEFYKQGRFDRLFK